MIRKTIVLIIGSVVLIVGIALIFLPGPAFILIPLGIAILALEFEWARKLIAWARRKLRGKDGSGRSEGSKE